MALKIRVESQKVKYTENYLEAEYEYQTTKVTRIQDKLPNYTVVPESKKLLIRTEVKLPKLGLMLVGWGGNNGTTITAALLANKLKLSWETKEGVKHANWFGSLVQASTVNLGTNDGKDVYVPMSSMLPIVDPNDIEIDGWDISNLNLADSMQRAQVLDINLQKQLREHMININGSPQNTFVPGAIELAERCKTFIAGDDFKSGQTKVKSVLVDFLVSAGIKPVSIVSYNHLGNNDGFNLSAPQQFRSKEISKSNVVDDMVNSNKILYNPGEKPDHCVVIKYVPYVGDSKRAMDEYTSELMLGGHNTIVIHNTCEDSLLASPIILDLVLLAELCSRITFKPADLPQEEFSGFHSILSILSYLCKAPLVPKDSPVVNAFFKQRTAIENILRACLSLPPENYLLLEHRLPLKF